MSLHLVKADFLSRLAGCQFQDLWDEVFTPELSQPAFQVGLGEIEKTPNVVTLKAGLQEVIRDLLRIQLIAGGNFRAVDDVSHRHRPALLDVALQVVLEFRIHRLDGQEQGSRLDRVLQSSGIEDVHRHDGLGHDRAMGHDPAPATE